MIHIASNRNWNVTASNRNSNRNEGNDYEYFKSGRAFYRRRVFCADTSLPVCRADCSAGVESIPKVSSGMFFLGLNEPQQ